MVGCTAPLRLRLDRPAVPGCLPPDVDAELAREPPLAAYACEGGSAEPALRDRWLLTVDPDGRARGVYTYLDRPLCLEREGRLGAAELAALRRHADALAAAWPASRPRAVDAAQRCTLYVHRGGELLRVALDDVPQPGPLGDLRGVLRGVDRALGAPVQIDTGQALPAEEAPP